ncbi:FAD-dependent oxidoreductase [Streptomyces johnsoniae]|uniref:FAD-dependent oxidoreductase n=1 Tax=Streptomyces johnsoniae TaxID=3075532 RepID=A0ABU2S5Z6_9ACTN|nr:FAD-dependent oxidoreductase [Streptomyces sp. DSM 41886]MDT0443055.1 FAD-dependent oxidoreductase [Streptomyces sp. DSM 41886]
MHNLTESYDVVVCGGGLAGLSAAVAAARHGARTCLVQDRPVLGGNSSSEIRVVPRGAAIYHAYARETGIVSELLAKERAANHEEIFENGWTNGVWDLVQYDLVMRTPNLTLHLNTTVTGVDTREGRITAVTARTTHAETELTLTGEVFVDCTGDGVVADLAGCEWRMGTEGRDEFREPHAPAHACDDVMGSSIHFKTRDVGHPVEFRLPSWAVEYQDASFFYQGGRRPSTLRGGFWWIEIGVPWHTIHDNERIRHELTRHALGVWDWIKNKDPQLKERAATYALDWIGQLPGKRESRRIMGLHLMTEHDLRREEPFPDEVAYGGWNIDLHTPGGLLAATSEPTAAEGHDPAASAAVRAYVGPFGIPLRSLVAKDVGNLLMAGRNVSATHVALGSVRVQNTTAVMGQAAGTAAAVAVRRGIAPVRVPDEAIGEVQQTLLRDGCFLPNVRNADPGDHARLARAVRASSQAVLHGAGPHDPWRGEGWDRTRKTGPDDAADELTARRGQWIAAEVADGRYTLDAIEVCLSNDTGEEREVAAALLPVDHIWDYRVAPAPPLATTVLRVPPGRHHWAEWRPDLGGADAAEALPGTGHRYLRLDLAATPGVRWHTASRVEPGHVSAFEMSSGHLRRYRNGVTASFRVSPPQACFGPANVLSGESRPHRAVNLWRSDPARPLPQWLEAEWDEPFELRTVQLTFAGHLIRDYETYGPLYRDPQCARDYTVEVCRERPGEPADWHPVVTVKGNHQPRRRHALRTPVSARRLRVVVQATNGDPSAALYELRCYS